MKRNIKNTIYTGIAIASSVAAMVSCTDTWDEHYNSSASSSVDGNLMQTIEKNAPDFARVVKAVKFDKELSSDNSFTVWAPQNFNVDSVLNLALTDSADVVDGFVKNHIARYNISMDGSAQSVSLINNKFALFTNQMFSSSNLVKKNIACSNGILHVIDNGAPFLMNLFELLREQYRESNYAYKDSVGGSLYTFLRKFDADSLDHEKSVSRGYDEYGEQIWVDSVVIRNNTALKNVDALIYEEDSNYIALLPTPEAYHKRFLEYKNLLKFNPKLNENIKIDGIDVCDSLANHYANMFAMNDLFYNMTNNKHMEDSLKSTTYASYASTSYKTGVYYRRDNKGQLKATHDILAGLTPTKCSNGTAYVIDEYPISIEEQAYYEIPLPASPSYLAKASDKSQNSKPYCENIDKDASNGQVRYGIGFTVGYDSLFVDDDGVERLTRVYDKNNPRVSNTTWYYYYPRVDEKKAANMAFFIPNYLAGTYDITLVTVPLWVHKYFFESGENLPSSTPSQFSINIFERNNKGEYPSTTSTATKFLNKTETAKTSKDYSFYAKNNCFIDTVYLGEYTFNNTYYGRGNTEDACGAMIQIKSDRKSPQLIVASIILTPKASKKDEEAGN